MSIKHRKNYNKKKKIKITILFTKKNSRAFQEIFSQKQQNFRTLKKFQFIPGPWTPCLSLVGELTLKNANFHYVTSSLMSTQQIYTKFDMVVYGKCGGVNVGLSYLALKLKKSLNFLFSGNFSCVDDPLNFISH